MRRVLHAEWTKFRTVRGWVVGVAAAALAMVALGIMGTSAPGTGHDAPRIPRGPGGEGVNDSAYFVHRSLTGDGSITVAVSSLTGVYENGPGGTARGVQPWAKAGIIVKANLAAGSSYAAIMVTGAHGVRMQHDYVHDTAGPYGTPRLLRLVRAGETVTGYASADGAHWTRVGAAKPAVGATVQAGMFVTSPEEMRLGGVGSVDPAMATGVFGVPALEGRWSGEWSGVQLGGNAGTSGSYSDALHGGFTESPAGFTVNGAGDIAPLVGGIAMGPGFTVESFLIGAFAGLIALIVVGTGFVTAEYRRGLIRTTLAASPRRGRVLAAKAVVLGSLAFAAGLVAAVAAVEIGEPRARSSGFILAPVSAATEVRVLVGTALLLAVVTVLALAVGAILRRSATAVTVVVAAVVLPYILAVSPVLPDGASRLLLSVTPAAGFAIQQSMTKYPQVITSYTPTFGYYPLAPWAGFAVLCGYTALAFAVAVVRLRRRDA